MTTSTWECPPADADRDLRRGTATGSARVETVPSGSSATTSVDAFTSPGAELRFTDLDLAADGAPARPLMVFDIGEVARVGPERIGRIAEEVRRTAALTVMVSRGLVAPACDALVESATVSLSETPGDDRRIVTVPDIAAALDALDTAVRHAPGAALACGQLLRQTPELDTTPALAAEAATYSMLLGGPEFARWLCARGPARAVPATASPVRIDRSADTLTVTLDHPARRNALSAHLREELLAALQVAEADPDISAVRLCGAGPSFCSGGDLDEFGCATDPVAAYLVRLDRAPWRLLDRLAGRVEVRVHGACIGAGAEMAAFAGTVTAAHGTYFRFPEVGMGLVPGAGGTVGVPRRIGRWRAAWLMLTGTTLDVHTAHAWGLVDHIERGAQS